MRRAARLLLYLGTAAVVLGLGKVHAAYIGLYDFTGSRRFAWSLAYVVLLCVAAYGVGLPDLPRNAYQALWSAAGACAGAALAVSVAQLLLASPLLPRFVVFWSAVFLVPGYALTGFVAARDRRRQRSRDRVVAVIDPEEVAALTRELTRNPERRASIVWAMSAADAHSDGPGHEPLVDAATDSGGTVLVLDREAQSDETVVAQAAVLHERGVRVRTLSLFYDEWLGKLPLSELERVALMFDIGEIHRARYSRLKRTLDLVLAVPTFLALVLAIVPVLLGDLVFSRGPLFYRQERVGRGGKAFTIYKFRTMRPHAGPTTWTTDDDPRVTGFGRLLRRTHVDELPQAINLMRGDLSVVGPRPEQSHYVSELSDKIRFYRLRHLVRPGVTGWAQVKYRYGASEQDALEKLQYEFWYLRHQGLGLDLRVVGRTIRSVVGGW